MTKLKPCPFCGGMATLEIDKEYEQSWVSCQNCGAETMLMYDDNGDVATEAWNRRAEFE